jgi:hypothetical protein
MLKKGIKYSCLGRQPEDFVKSALFLLIGVHLLDPNSRLGRKTGRGR